VFADWELALARVFDDTNSFFDHGLPEEPLRLTAGIISRWIECRKFFLLGGGDSRSTRHCPRRGLPFRFVDAFDCTLALLFDNRKLPVFRVGGAPSAFSVTGRRELVLVLAVENFDEGAIFRGHSECFEQGRDVVLHFPFLVVITFFVDGFEVVVRRGELLLVRRR